MKKQACSIMIILLVLFTLAGCSSTPKVTPLVPGDYPDPPANERYASMPVYISWDMVGDEYWDYEFSADGIIEEGSASPSPGQNAAEPLAEWTQQMTGGRYVWFHGVAPGDVVVTLTTTEEVYDEKSESMKVKGIVEIQQYAFRIYDDLTIALLHSEGESFR